MALLKETLPYLIPVLLFIGGSLFAIYQLKLNAIIQARIKWIENVRELISSLMFDINAIASEFSNMDADIKAMEEDGISCNEIEKYEKDTLKKIDELLRPNYNDGERKLFQLKLYLNKTHPDHIELVKRVEEFIEKTGDEEEEVIKECELLEEQIVDISRKIIQDEWNKVVRVNKLNPLY